MICLIPDVLFKKEVERRKKLERGREAFEKRKKRKRSEYRIWRWEKPLAKPGVLSLPNFCFDCPLEIWKTCEGVMDA